MISVSQQNAQKTLESAIPMKDSCDRKKRVKGAFKRAVSHIQLAQRSAAIEPNYDFLIWVVWCAASMAMDEGVNWRDAACSCSSSELADAINYFVVQNPVAEIEFNRQIKQIFGGNTPDVLQQVELYSSYYKEVFG